MEYVHRQLKKFAYDCGCKDISPNGPICAWILYLGAYEDFLLWRAQESLDMCLAIFEAIETACVRSLCVTLVSHI